MPSDQTPIDLELVAQALATPTSPSFYELEPTAARAVLDDLRAAPMGALPVAEEWINAPACGRRAGAPGQAESRHRHAARPGADA